MFSPVSLFQGTIVTLALLAAISIVISTLKTGISPMPSSKRACQGMVSLLAPPPEGIIFELGSGWGTLALAVSRRCSRASIVGLELSPLPWLVSRVLGRMLKAGNVEFRRQNFHDVSLTQASAVICYLFPGGMSELKDKLERELQPGTVVISNTFRVPGWTPDEILTLQDIYRTEIYHYTVPASTVEAPNTGPTSA